MEKRHKIRLPSAKLKRAAPGGGLFFTEKERGRESVFVMFFCPMPIDK